MTAGGDTGTPGHPRHECSGEGGCSAAAWSYSSSWSMSWHAVRSCKRESNRTLFDHHAGEKGERWWLEDQQHRSTGWGNAPLDVYCGDPERLTTDGPSDEGRAVHFQQPYSQLSSDDNRRQTIRWFLYNWGTVGSPGSCRLRVRQSEVRFTQQMRTDRLTPDFDK